MPKVYQSYLDKVQSRISASTMNLLAMAAPLESSYAGTSSKPKTSANTEIKKVLEPHEVPNQKAMLLAALLSIGALRPALAMLTMFPWLVDSHTEIADLLLRVLKTSLGPLYDSVMLKKEPTTSFSQPRPRYSAGGVVKSPSRKAQLTLCAPTPPSTYTQDFVFFFPEWSHHVPMCTEMEDLVDVIEPLMRFIGLHVSREPLFLTKLLRLGKAHLSSTVS